MRKFRLFGSKKEDPDIQRRYEMSKDIEEIIATRKGVPFTEKFIRGLPIGLKLSNGLTVGDS